MPRKVRDSALESRTARSKLKVQHKPYFRLIEPGLHLGYRKLASGPGTWIARRYSGEGAYTAKNLKTPDGALVIADDFVDADGKHVLSFAQAQAMARQARDERSPVAKGPYTVRRALQDYFAFLQHEGRPEHLVAQTEQQASALIVPKLGDAEVSALTSKQLHSWRDGLVKVGARVRTKKGEIQQYREVDDDEDALRARRASANRVWTTLRAALNHAFDEGDVTSDREWRKVKPFKGVDGKCPTFLSVDEAKRLINACDGDFRTLVQAALQTGGRYGSLARLRVRDFHSLTGTIDLSTRKGDGSEKTFSVILSEEGLQFFRHVCTGRGGQELMLTKDNGSPWEKGHQIRPMEDACKRAKIADVNFNQLRHTWASLALMNGTPLLVVAENLGHSDTRMVERHYGHITREYAKDRIQEGAPRFGFMPDKKVVGPVLSLGARQ
jgi:integrase